MDKKVHSVNGILMVHTDILKRDGKRKQLIWPQANHLQQLRSVAISWVIARMGKPTPWKVYPNWALLLQPQTQGQARPPPPQQCRTRERKHRQQNTGPLVPAQNNRIQATAWLIPRQLPNPEKGPCSDRPKNTTIARPTQDLCFVGPTKGGDKLLNIHIKLTPECHTIHWNLRFSLTFSIVFRNEIK